jgi:hypothetical protein
LRMVAQGYARLLTLHICNTQLNVPQYTLNYGEI